MKKQLSAIVLATLLLVAAGAAAQADDALVAKGKYLATAGDCTACHTAPGNKPFAGGYPFRLPMGSIISSNITPSKTAGIGNWTEEQFARAVREGIRPDGTHLYPAMPYTEYALITDEDMQALYAYFINGVKAVDEKPAATTRIDFPFNLPGMMTVWNMLFLDGAQFKPSAAQSDEVNRGRYLADGLAHCTTCHTPRNNLMALDKSRYLGGAVVEGWHAPNLTSDPLGGLGGWSKEEIRDYLKNGHIGSKSQAGGPMADAVQHSLRHLEDADLLAIAAYLKTVPPLPTEGQSTPAFQQGGKPAAGFGVYEKPIADNRSPERYATNGVDGASLYNSACAACHGIDGRGTEDSTYPALRNNRAVGSVYPNGVVMAVAHGIHREGADRSAVMPAFAADLTAIHAPLSNDQIAAVTNYVRSEFGSVSATLSGTDVGDILSGGKPAFLIRNAATLAIVGFCIGGLVLLAAIFLIGRRLARGN